MDRNQQLTATGQRVTTRKAKITQPNVNSEVGSSAAVGSGNKTVSSGGTISNQTVKNNERRSTGDGAAQASGNAIAKTVRGM